MSEVGGPPAAFRFSVRRMLLLVVLLSVWLAGLRVLSEPWSVWLTTAVFYLVVVLMFTPRRARTFADADNARNTSSSAPASL